MLHLRWRHFLPKISNLLVKRCGCCAQASVQPFSRSAIQPSSQPETPLTQVGSSRVPSCFWALPFK